MTHFDEREMTMMIYGPAPFGDERNLRDPVAAVALPDRAVA